MASYLLHSAFSFKPKRNKSTVQSVCKAPNCKREARFGLLGSKWAQHCAAHKQDHEMDVHRKSCIVQTCLQTATYLAPGNTKPIYCREHKSKQDSHHRRVQCHCGILACFGDPKEGIKPRFCAQHKGPNDIDLVNLVRHLPKLE